MEIKLTKHASHLKEALQIAISLPEYFTKEALTNIEQDLRSDYLIIAQDDLIEGFLCFGMRNNRYEILWMAVKKEMQDKGIGKQMLTFLIQHLKSKGIEKLYVKTLSPEDPYEPYKRTRKFYEDNGFKPLYIEKAKKKGWDDQVVMHLTL